MKNFNSYFLFLIILFFSSSFNSFDKSIVWGSIGHKVVGEIAERKLNPNVRLVVNDLLDGESMASASTWAEEIQPDPQSTKYNPRHYAKTPQNKEY